MHLNNTAKTFLKRGLSSPNLRSRIADAACEWPQKGAHSQATDYSVFKQPSFWEWSEHVEFEEIH